ACSNGPPGPAKELRQIVSAKRDLCDHAPAPPATTLQGPIQLGVLARIDRPQTSVGGHDLRFEQTARGRAESFRERTEPAALDQPGNTHGRAPATLNITSGLGGHRV